MDVAWHSSCLYKPQLEFHLVFCPQCYNCQLKLLRIWLMRPARWLATTDDENPGNKTVGSGRCAGKHPGDLLKVMRCPCKSFVNIWQVAKLHSWLSHSALTLQILLLLSFSFVPLWKTFYRPVISEQWAVFLSAVAVCKLSAHMGWLLLASLLCEGRQSRWDTLLPWSDCMCVWQTRTGGDDSFAERKWEYPFDLLCQILVFY